MGCCDKGKDQWKERIVIIGFGVLLAWLGGGAMRIAQEVVWLRLFGVETPAKVIDLYQQDGDWFVTYQFDVAGATYSGLAPAPRTANIGGAVVIAYLPRSPEVSNTMQEVRWGAILGPLFLLPSGVILSGTGIWLVLKGVVTSSAKLHAENSSDDRSATKLFRRDDTR